MLDAFYISSVGLHAQKAQLDVIAENLSNAGTAAYKRRAVDFSSLLDRSAATSPSAAPGDGQVRLTRVDMRGADIRQTGRALDFAISGAGFVEATLPDNRMVYSRGGSLQIDDNGMLTLPGGQVLKAEIRIPAGATNAEVLPDGSVRAMLAGDTQPTVIGQLELVSISNLDALTPVGAGVYEAQQPLADVARAMPGDDWAQALEVRSVEGSNVRMVDEMVNLLLAQRIYELNAKVAQTADEMMGLTNALRK